MRALVEEIVGTVAVAKIVELPRLISASPAPHDFLIHEHFNRAKIPLEVPSIGVGLRQSGWRDLRIVLGGRGRGVAKPVLQFEEGHRLFGVEELRGDRGTAAMAGDVAARVGPGHSGLSAECRNEHVIEVAFADDSQAKEEQKFYRLASLCVGKFHTISPYRPPGRTDLVHEWIDWFRECRGSLIYRHVEHAN